jgi:D-alanine-D-alanine ligase
LSDKIAVLLGGTSPERDVSLISGMEIAKALRQCNYQVQAIDCAFGDQLIEDWDADINEVIHVEHSHIDQRHHELDRNILQTMDYLLKEKFNVVFNALHGGYGENGKLQALLDMMDIPYTGSGALASGLGMNKHFSKILFRSNQVNTPDWIKIDQPDNLPDTELNSLNLPLVVKPNDQGSTVGLTVIKDRHQLADAIELAFHYSPVVLVETYIADKEITVSILNGEPLPVVEIIPEHGIYDYECKYQMGKSQYKVPAEFPEKIIKHIQEQAVRAYNVLQCRHYARVDMRLSTEYQPFTLELNTLPGMTPTSLVPKAAMAAGISFPELVDRIVKMALLKKV